MSRRVLFGPPGTGKTHSLLEIVGNLLSAGVDSKQIGYMAFSRKAAHEAVNRAKDKFNLDDMDIPWFSTLHSTAFRLMERTRKDMVGDYHLEEFGHRIGYEFQTTGNLQEIITLERDSVADECWRLMMLSRALLKTEDDTWQQYATPGVVSSRSFKLFCTQYHNFKKQRELHDFCDLLSECDRQLDLHTLIIDEGQDLTPQQWEFVNRLAPGADLWIAGDDDQSIYGFSGATAAPMMAEGNRSVLPYSFRLPARVKTLADHIIGQVEDRYPKTYQSQAEPGTVRWISDPQTLDLSQGTWLLLARCRHDLRSLVSLARGHGVVYHHEDTWSNRSPEVRAVLAWEQFRKDGGKLHARDQKLLQKFMRPEAVREQTWMEALSLPEAEIEYIRGLRRRGESLTKPGRVVISTVHQAKGGEADNVVLLTDATRRIANDMMTNKKRCDEELRVLYVGVTRTRQNLYLVLPQRDNNYSLYIPRRVE